jgi:hypothetical protein
MVVARRSILVWGAVSLAALIAGFLSVVFYPPQRNLLARSRRVLALPNDPTGSYGSSALYCWQSDTQLITNTFNGGGFDAQSVDLKAGTVRPVPSLSSWVWLDDQWNKAFSPDGKWALASVPHTALFARPHGRWAIPTSIKEVIAASDTTLIVLSDSLGGQKSTQAVFSGTVSPAFWLSDSRHWAIALHTHNGWFVQIHDRTQPKQTALIPIQHGLRAQMNDLWYDPFFSTSQPPGISSNTVFLFPPSQYNNTFADNSVLLKISISSIPAPVEAVTVPLPSDASLLESHRNSTLQAVSVSPNGKFVAWVLDFQERQKIYPTAWDSFREQYINGQAPPGPQPYPTEEVWVSRSDGSAMHEIAHLPAAVYGSRQILQLRWTPSGQQLSFVYKDALYVMPVADPWHG